MAVAALTARFWTYHRWYDDLLILIPMIALFRIAKEAETEDLSTWAGVLVGVGVVAMIAPGGLYCLYGRAGSCLARHVRLFPAIRRVTLRRAGNRRAPGGVIRPRNPSCRAH